MRYSLELARAGLRIRHKLAQARLLRDFTAWIRVEFLGAAAGMGLFRALGQPRTAEELAEELAITEPQLLISFLTLGETLGELRKKDDRWALRGARARALADPTLEGWSGMAEEAVAYDADVYLTLLRRLRGEPPGDYLPQTAEMVARASRLSEPILEPFVHDLVRRLRITRVLDVGCGSGVYLRAAAGASAAATGVGVDLRPDVVAAASRNLAAWGIAHRFTAREADARAMPPDLGGPWDLVLLFQNFYYFAPSERPAVLGGLRALTPNGTLAVVTIVAGTSDPFAAHLDIVLRSTEGNHGLPTTKEVHDALHAGGFSTVGERRLVPGVPIRAFVAG